MREHIVLFNDVIGQSKAKYKLKFSATADGVSNGTFWAISDIRNCVTGDDIEPTFRYDKYITIFFCFR